VNSIHKCNRIWSNFWLLNNNQQLGGPQIYLLVISRFVPSRRVGDGKEILDPSSICMYVCIHVLRREAYSEHHLLHSNWPAISGLRGCVHSVFLKLQPASLHDHCGSHVVAIKLTINKNTWKRISNHPTCSNCKIWMWLSLVPEQSGTTIPFQLFADFVLIILFLSSWQLRNDEKLLGIYIFVMAIGKYKNFKEIWRIESSGRVPEVNSRCLRKTSPVHVCHTARQPTWELSDTKIRTFHTETCHSSNVPFYQLVNTRARGIPLPLKFCRVAHMLLVYGGLKFGMVWTPRGFATRSEICLHHPICQKHKFWILQQGKRHPT